MSVDMTIVGVSSAVDSVLNNISGLDFSDVYASPESDTTKIKGFPTAFHFYERTDPSYATVTQNRRVIQHNVFIYFAYVGKTEEEKWATATGQLDKAIQAFDESIDLNGACDIMRPAPGEIGKVSTSAGEALVAEIIIYAEADITFRDA